jgi:hypothetical protein
MVSSIEFVETGDMIDIDRIHTTELGEERIRRNLSLDTDDVTEWCRQAIRDADSSAIVRKGKNWYVHGDGFVLTINASSHTVITAHVKSNVPKKNTRDGSTCRTI